MGGKWRRRNRQNDENDSQFSQTGQSREDARPGEGIRLGSHTVKGPRKGNNLRGDNPFQRSVKHHQQHSRNGFFSDRADRTNHHYVVDHHSCMVKNEQFKQYLLQSIEESRRKIEQWCPDDNSNLDRMDWQPESELVIPQNSGKILYIWDMQNSKSLPGDCGKKRPLEREIVVGETTMPASMNANQGPRKEVLVSTVSNLRDLEPQSDGW